MYSTISKKSFLKKRGNVISYCANDTVDIWLLSACAYDLWQQGNNMLNIHTTGLKEF